MEPALALGSDDPTARTQLPSFGRERMRAFVLDNFDRFANLGQPLPTLSQDALRFVSQSYRTEEVAHILESFAGLFPGLKDTKTDNVIEIYDADDLSAEIAAKIQTVSPGIAKTITNGIADGSLCWSGKIPTGEKEIPVVMVSQQADPQALSQCLYRGVMAHMGVTILYKDRLPTTGRLDAILSHMANITAMHIYFECRDPIRVLDFPLARTCVERRLDQLY